MIFSRATIFHAALLCFAAPLTQSFHQPNVYTQTLPCRLSVSRKLVTLETPVVNGNTLSKASPLASVGTTRRLESSTQLEAVASSLLSTASSPVGAFLILTAIIVIHECGHYFAARSYGIKVEEFSIGFGPKLAGFEAFGNEFNFRAIPLGGYVRFPENYNITLVQEQRVLKEKARRERRKEFQEADSGSDASTLDNNKKTLGYRLTNLLTFGALEKQQRKKQDEKETIREKQKGETNKSKWWKSLFGASSGPKQPPTPPKDIGDPNEEVEIEYYDDPDLLQNRPWFQRAVVLSGGVIFNLLLAFSIYFGQMSTIGLPQPVFDFGIVVSQNPAREAASSGILRKGDVVVGVNGNSFSMPESPSAVASQKAISDFISVIRATPDGDTLHVSIIRSKGTAPVNVDIQPKRLDPSGPKTIGVMLTPNYVKTQVIKFDNPVHAVGPASKLVYSGTKETASGLLTFFGQLIAGKDTGGQQVSGPIGLIKTGSDVVASNNWNTVLAFSAAISINLGVVNAFPLPALDGGQLVFILAEAVTKRKVDQRLQEEIVGITVLLLLLVSVSAALGDVQNIMLKK